MRPVRSMFFRRALYGLQQATAMHTGSCGSCWSSPCAQGFSSPGCSCSAVSEGTQFLVPIAHPPSFPLKSLWQITETAFSPCLRNPDHLSPSAVLHSAASGHDSSRSHRMNYSLHSDRPLVREVESFLNTWNSLRPPG